MLYSAQHYMFCGIQKKTAVHQNKPVHHSVAEITPGAGGHGACLSIAGGGGGRYRFLLLAASCAGHTSALCFVPPKSPDPISR